MAQSHRYCDHPATKSARAKCRRQREQFGEDYTANDQDWQRSYDPPPRQRRQQPKPFCAQCRTRHNYWENHNWGNYRDSGAGFNWDDLFTRREPRIVANDNGGYKVTDYGKGREDLHRDDQARSPLHRRIVQLERKAASTSSFEAAACMAMARKLRERAGVLGTAI